MRRILLGSLFVLAPACATTRPADVRPLVVSVTRVEPVAGDEATADPPMLVYEWKSGRCMSQSEASPEAACVSIADVVHHHEDHVGRRVRLNAFVSVVEDAHAVLTDGLPPYEKLVVNEWTMRPCAPMGHFIVEANVTPLPEPTDLTAAMARASERGAVELDRAVVIGVADGNTNCDVAQCRPREGCPER